MKDINDSIHLSRSATSSVASTGEGIIILFVERTSELSLECVKIVFSFK